MVGKQVAIKCAKVFLYKQRNVFISYDVHIPVICTFNSPFPCIRKNYAQGTSRHISLAKNGSYRCQIANGSNTATSELTFSFDGNRITATSIRSCNIGITLSKDNVSYNGVIDTLIYNFRTRRMEAYKAPLFKITNFFKSNTSSLEFDVLFLQNAIFKWNQCPIINPNNPNYTNRAIINNNNSSTKPVEIQASPNPFSQNLTVEYDLPNDENDLSITLFDATGRAVKTNTGAPRTAGKQQITLETADILRGLYFIDIRTPTMHRTMKVIKLE